jgi:hypothetical protein
MIKNLFPKQLKQVSLGFLENFMKHNYVNNPNRKFSTAACNIGIYIYIIHRQIQEP